MNRGIGTVVGLASLLAFAASCKFEREVIPATQLVVDIDAEPSVRARLDSVQVFVAGARHRDNLEERTRVFDASIQPGSAPESPQFPVRVVLTPEAGDARRVFELTATALDLSGAQVAQARVITGYVSHQIRWVRLVLEDDCIGVTCDDLETCEVGGCKIAFVDPRDLPLLPGRTVEAGVIDAGEAGPPPPDTGVDAGPDAGADGGIDSGVDSGPVEDPCLRVDHGGCDPLVVCQTIDGVPTCGQCPNGFVDVNGNGSRCEDIDECNLPDKGGCDAAHGRCTNTAGSHDCSCEAGYNGDGRECSVNVPCGDDPNVCDALATCQTIQGDKVCQCKTGYEGDGGHCKNIDECMRNLDDCPIHAACSDSEGAFTCTCNTGYEKPSSGANDCVDINECTRMTDNCDDMPDACMNTDGSFMCKCPAGYEGSGLGNTCADIDECMRNTDGCDTNPDACLNDIGGFHCMCPAGYRGSGVGNSCVDINQCNENTDDCAPAPATCTNMTGTPGFMCACPAGYTGAGTIASACADIDECMGTNDCNTNSDCVNTVGSFNCTCRTGYTSAGAMPGHGTSGCMNVNECMGTNDCNTNADCADTVGSFNCNCRNGYMPAGSNPGHGSGGCVGVDFCAPGGGNDCNTNADCANTPGSFTCTCKSAYMGAGANPGHGGGGCVDRDECAPGGNDDCNANADCMNTTGSFNCTCKPGYSGATATPGHGSGGCVDEPGCNGSPCMNGGTCNDVAAPGTGHTCSCACGFSGSNCQDSATRTNAGFVSLPDMITLLPAKIYSVKIDLLADAQLVAFGLGGVMNSGSVRLALYRDSSSSPGARVATVGPVTAGSGTFPLSSCVTLTAGSYWVAYLSVADSVTIGAQTGSFTQATLMPATDFPDPFGMSTAENGPNLALYIVTVPP
jgi:hypothetical protein